MVKYIKCTKYGKSSYKSSMDAPQIEQVILDYHMSWLEVGSRKYKKLHLDATLSRRKWTLIAQPIERRPQGLAEGPWEPSAPWFRRLSSTIEFRVPQFIFCTMQHLSVENMNKKSFSGHFDAYNTRPVKSFEKLDGI